MSQIITHSSRDIMYRLNCLLTCGDAVSYDNQKEYNLGIRETNQTITYIMTPAPVPEAPARKTALQKRKKSQQLQGPDQLL